MKYKQEYLKLQKQLAEETKEKERYKSYWHTEKDTTASQEEEISKLKQKFEDLETSSLKLEVEMLKEIVGLYKRIKDPSHEDTVSPQVDDRYNVTSSSVITPNITTSSSTSLTNGFRS